MITPNHQEVAVHLFYLDRTYHHVVEPISDTARLLDKSSLVVTHQRISLHHRIARLLIKARYLYVAAPRAADWHPVLGWSQGVPSPGPRPPAWTSRETFSPAPLVCIIYLPPRSLPRSIARPFPSLSARNDKRAQLPAGYELAEPACSVRSPPQS